MGAIALQPKGLTHPDNESSHHPDVPRAIVSTDEKEEDKQRLYQREFGSIKEVGLS